MTLLDQDLRHLPAGLPVAGVVEGVHELLDTMAPFEPMPAGRYADLVRATDKAVARLQALKLKLLAEAGRTSVAADTGAASTSAWHASVTRTDPAESARQARLAEALEGEQLAETSAAFEHGDVSQAHAAVIAEALRRLPAGLDTGQVAAVESALLGKAKRFDPRRLRQEARRALEAVERDQARVDAAEDAQLRDEEARARRRTRLTLHDNGDGTVSGHFTVPVLAGSVLVKVVDQLASPRRGRVGATAAQVGDPDTANPAGDRFDWARRRGEAFVTLLEALPTDRLHGKVAATVVVTLDHDALRGQLRAAGLDTGERISAAEARRLACGAGLLPAVLAGGSLPLDLGRTRRFFTEAQRVAGATRWRSCAADGCDTPYAWTELHHRDPWSSGGRTDLADMVPLCSFHHHRIHDPGYHHRHHPTGVVTFRRRT